MATSFPDPTAWAGAQAVVGGRPGLFVLVQIVTDVELLAPIVTAAKSRFTVRVAVTSRALRKTPELARSLERAFVGTAFEVVDEEELAAGRVDLTGVQAVLAATESTAPAHVPAHSLALFANARGLHTATLQHGHENIGLTWFDAEFPPSAIRFASRTIFTWGPLERLHRDVLPDTRVRCRPVGCPKPALAPIATPSAAPPWGTRRSIAVFENLHWKRYSADYRERFLADLEAAAAADRERVFVVKPHPAGKWLTKRFEGRRPEAENLFVLVPGDARFDAFDANALLARAEAVITTPSTIALDAARAGRPVAVTGYDLDLPAYEPLPILRSGDDWRTFLADPRTALVRGTTFVGNGLVPGDAASRIVEHLHAAVAAGPAHSVAPTRVVMSTAPEAPRRWLRWIDRFFRREKAAATPAYVVDRGTFALTSDAEAVVAKALQAVAAAGRPAPKALLWDDAITAVHWRKRRLRMFGVRRTHRDALSLAATDLVAAGAVRADLAGTDPSRTLRELVVNEPGEVLFVEGVWRFVGLAADGRGTCAVPRVPGARANKISVLVNFRDLVDATCECIHSLAQQETTAIVELLLIDNQSKPESLQRIESVARRLAAERGRMEVVVMPFDEAFNHSRQNNLAAELATGDVIVFLNNDARLLSRDLLQEIADEALAPNVATVGPRIVGRGSQLVCAGMTWSALPAPWADSREVTLRELEGPGFAERRRGSVGESFCVAAIAKAAWASSGGLDEAEFPTQYNDADFCLRMLARGLQHVHRGDLVAFHQPGGSEPRRAAEIRKRHAALLVRHANASPDHIAPDHYELPKRVEFAGAEAAAWRWLLRSQRPDAPGFVAAVAERTDGVPADAVTAADERDVQWRAVRALVDAACEGDRLPPSLRIGMTELLSYAPPASDVATDRAVGAS